MDKIITCIDGSTITPSVTEAGIWAAQKLNKILCFLHTLEKGQQHGADDYTGAIGFEAQSTLLNEITKLDEQKNKLALQLGAQLLNSIAQTAHSKGISAVEKLQRHGNVVEAVIALEKETALVVIGRTGADHEGSFKAIGSHIETLLRKSTHPVLIVPEKFTQPTSVMIAYDGRASADNALQKVLDGGLLQGLLFHLVSVRNNDTSLEQKFLMATKKLKDKGHNVSTAFLKGRASEALLTYQTEHNIDLILMGAYGHSRLRQIFIGSTTLEVFEKVTAPLLILK